MLQGIAAKYAGAGVFISFLIAGMVSLLTALIYAEFSSRMPFSGSGYIYLYTSLGELPAWVVGWNMNLRFGVTAGAQSKVWASYMVGLLNLLGFALPVWLYKIEVLGSVNILLLTSYSTCH
jgi:APA family basic amino acid/polyamine antiporter